MNSEVETNSQLNERVLKDRFEYYLKKQGLKIKNKTTVQQEGCQKVHVFCVGVVPCFDMEILRRGLYCNRVKRYMDIDGVRNRITWELIWRRNRKLESMYTGVLWYDTRQMCGTKVKREDWSAFRSVE